MWKDAGSGVQGRIGARRPAGRRAAFTLLELLVAIAIISVLVAVAFLGTHHAYSYIKKSSAQQQMTLIATAIDQYKDFWPAWKYGNTPVADKGWPDFIPGRLFLSTANTGPFGVIAGFNDKVTFDLDGPNSGINYGPNGDMLVSEGDVEHAAECLAYALTAKSGKGPYIKDEMKGNLQTAHDKEFYPNMTGSAGGQPRGEFVDPWGTPIRYFWVFREPNLATPRGFLPVITANSNDANFRVANGFVLESAGPDKKFGNIWKVNPSTQEIQDAADNITITP